MPFAKTAIASAAACAALIFSSAAVAKPTSIRGLAAQEVHLATIAYRISAANAAACPEREFLTGMILHDLTRYEPGVRAAVSRAFSVNTGFGVLAVVPGSVAAEAGLQVDDEIVAVGRYGVADTAAHKRPRSFQRMEQFHATVEAALRGGQTDLVVRRGGNLLRLPLRAQHGCGGKLALMSSSTLNAWSDGRNVVVTTGMTSLSRSDDEIAFVIAHEMAHNILGHSRGNAKSRGIFGFSGIKRGEIEADGYAVRLMANAGYRPAGGIAFLENARRRLWWNVSLDHPGFGSRMRTIAAAMEAERGSAAPQRAAMTGDHIEVASSSLPESPLNAGRPFTTAALTPTAVPRAAAQTGYWWSSESCER